MLRRWLLYLAVLAGCVIFLIAYQGWMAWLFLSAALLLPLFALGISLPAMSSAKLYLDCPGDCLVGENLTAQVRIRAWVFLPEFRCRVQIFNPLTNETRYLLPGNALPTDSCGRLQCRLEKVRIYDCLGLFYRTCRSAQTSALCVRPHPLAVNAIPRLESTLSNIWRPKPGGGFGENHELRLYRPGDNLNQIHWKLTAKTSKYIIREPMVPQQNALALAMVLSGTAEQLQRKLGRLLWLGKYLLDKGIPFQILAQTGSGAISTAVTTEDDLFSALDLLLGQSPAQDDTLPDTGGTRWHYLIGGEADES